MNELPNQNILYVDTLCQELYSPKSQEQRANAERLLDVAFPTFSETSTVRANGASPLGVKIQSPLETSMFCRWLLEKSTSPYAQMFAAARLKGLVLDHYTMFSMPQKMELSTDYQPFVLSSLAQLFATITKVGWFEGEEFKNITNDLSNFIQSTPDHIIVGLQILSITVAEMNQQSPRNLTKQRKTAIGFRDTALLEIFQLGLVVMRRLLNGGILFANDLQEHKTKEYCLTLLRNCLAFDFIGTSPDESGEDVGSIQVTSSWRSTVEDPSFLQIMFEAYKQFQPPHSSQVMEVLVQISSIRRSLFNEEERSKFLYSLMKGISEILIGNVGLSDLSNYHEFCRLLSRFRSTYQLSEIAEKSGYNEWIDLVADFSIKGFNNWQLVPNSVQYLLTFWSKMLSSTGSSRSGSITKLELIASRLTHTFITSKIESVETAIEGVIDDPLENEDALINDLEMFANIARCKYDEANTAITNAFNPVAQQFQALLQQANTSVVHDYLKILDVIETKFAWLVYMIGGLIGGRQTYVSTEDQDLIDGELTCKVVNLLTAVKSWNGPRGNDTGYEKLELAFIYFFQQFRKSYIGENVQKISKVYSKLSDQLGINDQTMCSKIIQRTVALFNDLAGGYTSVRLLRNIPTTQFIIQKHTVKDFPFLDAPNNLRTRIIYYSALSRVLFADDNVERDFEEFVRPWDITMAQLGALNSFEAFRQPAVKVTLSGIFRDLRGFLSAIQGRKNFLIFFEWFYPNYMQILCRALEAWSDDILAITILKFFLEFVNNRTQRLNFDISSPNGHQIKNRPLMSLDKYIEKYKGISICFNILTKSFAGRYVNFGVFALYGDNALEIALKTSFEMMLSVPIEDILAYPKFSRALFDWLDTFTNEYMMALPNMDSDVFLYIMRSLAEAPCSSACNAIDHICTFVVQQSAMQKPKQHWLLVYLNEFSTVLPTLFVANFNVVLFEDRQNQWSLSRPLLCLILLNQDYLNKYTENILQHQLPERREALRKAIKTLMEDVDFNLTTKNRDKFTQNLSTFKRELTNGNVILVPPPMDAKIM
ncbi:27229_t:CDS:10 [Gigaspora margarita]|uniref:27229_t:CDS:1 n=1 Tax=Gigaspora margarita TaxID=4874 RepID=A0ABM8VZW5_GIGMA|nr:27229_t:CDS:10 [Gigaspora margarita]